VYDAMTDVQVDRPAPGAAVVEFLGEHDLASRDDLSALLLSLVEENDLVVADFSEALFVDSTTLHVLLDADNAARARGRTFRLQLGTAAIVRMAFELSGMTKRLECVETRAEALGGEGTSRATTIR
jgi:anti-anti-sigma factor